MSATFSDNKNLWNEELEDMREHLNESQFALAMKGKKFRAKTKTILHRILVEEEDKMAVREELSLDLNWLNSAIKEALQNLDDQVAAHDMEIVMVVLRKGRRELLEILEKDEIELSVK